MSWEGSDRRSRLPADWPSLVAQVKKRAGGRCEKLLPQSGQRCPRPGTDVDHKQPGDNHALWNLQLLCPHHHGKKTAAEAWQGKRRKKGPKKAQESHPGLRRRPTR